MLTWATCTRLRVCSASSASRAMMLASATAGQPGRPSRPETSPSWQQACGPARLGSWLCWETTPSKARTYSRARRITRPSATQWPSSEKTCTFGAGAVHQAELGELRAVEALGDRADRDDVDQAGGEAERPET